MWIECLLRKIASMEEAATVTMTLHIFPKRGTGFGSAWPMSRCSRAEVRIEGIEE